MHNPDFSKPLTAKQVADEYFGGGMSYWTVLEHAKNNRLPHRRIGGKYFFKKESLDKLFDSEKAS